jgi:hypothetical protein
MSSLLTYLWSVQSNLEDFGPGIDLMAISSCKREWQVAEEIKRGCARLDDTVIDANVVVSPMSRAHLHECRKP